MRRMTLICKEVTSTCLARVYACDARRVQVQALIYFPFSVWAAKTDFPTRVTQTANFPGGVQDVRRDTTGLRLLYIDLPRVRKRPETHDHCVARAFGRPNTLRRAREARQATRTISNMEAHDDLLLPTRQPPMRGHGQWISMRTCMRRPKDREEKSESRQGNGT